MLKHSLIHFIHWRRRLLLIENYDVKVIKLNYMKNTFIMEREGTFFGRRKSLMMMVKSFGMAWFSKKEENKRIIRQIYTMWFFYSSQSVGWYTNVVFKFFFLLKLLWWTAVWDEMSYDDKLDQDLPIMSARILHGSLYLLNLISQQFKVMLSLYLVFIIAWPWTCWLLVKKK